MPAIPSACIYMDQLISIGAEKPLGKKHINLEPYAQSGPFMLRMFSHLGDDELAGEWGSPRRIHEEMRDLQHKEPHLEADLGCR